MTEFLHRTSSGAQYWWPIIFRGVLYFFIAAAPAFIDATKDVGQIEVVPPIQWLRIILLSTLAGAVSVRAFMDGSIQRHKDDNPKPATP